MGVHAFCLSAEILSGGVLPGLDLAFARAPVRPFQPARSARAIQLSHLWDEPLSRRDETH